MIWSNVGIQNYANCKSNKNLIKIMLEKMIKKGSKIYKAIVLHRRDATSKCLSHNNFLQVGVFGWLHFI